MCLLRSYTSLFPCPKALSLLLSLFYLPLSISTLTTVLLISSMSCDKQDLFPFVLFKQERQRQNMICLRVHGKPLSHSLLLFPCRLGFRANCALLWFLGYF